MPTTNLTKEQALQKLKHYCGYQERCHSEVIEKLYSLGVWKKDHGEIISTLIEENYLNEERFALAFARGKFKMKQWGKKKILYELKQKQISDYCIKKAMAQIEDNDYDETLKELAEKRWAALKSEKNIFTKMTKLRDHLMRKGYSGSEIEKVLKILRSI